MGRGLFIRESYQPEVRAVESPAETGGSVYELTLEKGWFSKEALHDILSPEHMTHPRQVPEAEQK